MKNILTNMACRFLPVASYAECEAALAKGIKEAVSPVAIAADHQVQERLVLFKENIRLRSAIKERDGFIQHVTGNPSPFTSEDY